MIIRGVTLPSIVSILPVRTLAILFGGDVVIGYHVFCVLVYCCFGFSSM